MSRKRQASQVETFPLVVPNGAKFRDTPGTLHPIDVELNTIIIELSWASVIRCYEAKEKIYFSIGKVALSI